MLNGANIAKINFQIVADIKQELRLQGHYLTGELEQSFQEKQILNESEVVLEAYAYAFLQDLEKGVQAEDIPPLNVSSKEFANLVKWVKLRGLDTNGYLRLSAESIAEAIWRKWQKDGKPLATSKEFSKTGEILFAVANVFSKQDENYFAKIDEEVVLSLDKEFFNDNNN